MCQENNNSVVVVVVVVVNWFLEGLSSSHLLFVFSPTSLLL
jgi:hypothetical protein